MSASNSIKGGILTLLAAIIAAGASTLCCIGPLLYLLFGISAAGLVGIPGASWLQIPMVLVAVGLMARGFWRLYLSPKPVCISVVSRRVLVWLYWIAVPLVLVLITYPYVLPWILERME
ncbi:mercuric transporter MerT family protein [Kluyvera sp. STS39-E]|uniref:mercuric transporter MerT family protein n=1 Tax=Kluyvera sp. STS39-E TaxID=3234748 RepID=UPI0034C6AC13